jgi:hypothetical protein
MFGKELFKQDGSYYLLTPQDLNGKPRARTATPFIVSRSENAVRSEVATTIAGTWFPPYSEFDAFLGSVKDWPLTGAGKATLASFDPKATAQKDCIGAGVPNLMFYPVADTITVQRDRVVMKVDWMDGERPIFLDRGTHPPANQTFLHGHSIGHRSGRWQYSPNMRHTNEKCDLTAEVPRLFQIISGVCVGSLVRSRCSNKPVAEIVPDSQPTSLARAFYSLARWLLGTSPGTSQVACARCEWARIPASQPNL